MTAGLLTKALATATKDGMIEKTVEAGAADSQEETAKVAEAPTTEEKTEDNII